MYSKLSLVDGIIHGELCAVGRLNLYYALTSLPFQSHIDEYLEIHVFLYNILLYTFVYNYLI